MQEIKIIFINFAIKKNNKLLLYKFFWDNFQS